MEEEPILREALLRYDAALEEARRLDAFIHMYGDLRKSPRLTIGRSEEFLLEGPRVPAWPTPLAHRKQLGPPAGR